jgi:hypothetical protein
MYILICHTISIKLGKIFHILKNILLDNIIIVLLKYFKNILIKK